MSAKGMYGSPDLERDLGDWLKDEGPQDVPDRVVEAAISRAATVTRLRPWPAVVNRLLDTTVPIGSHMGRGTLPRSVPAAMWAAFVLLATALLAATLVGIGALLVRERPEAANGLIAYEAGGDIWLIPPEGTAVGTRLTKTPGSIEGNPSWSPDGRSLAYWVTTDVTTEIHVVDEHGRIQRILTAPEGLLLPAVSGISGWSPDARSIAVPARGTVTQDGVTRVGVDRVIVFDVVNGDPSPLESDIDAWSFGWSRDGRVIGLATDNDLYFVPIEGGPATRLTGGPGSASALAGTAGWSVAGSVPSFGSDGLLVYTGVASGLEGEVAGQVRRDGDIVTARIDRPAKPVTLVGGPTNDVAARVSPDGRLIAFGRSAAASAEGALFDVHVPGAASRGAELVLLDIRRPEAPRQLASDVWPDAAWAPNGRQLLTKSLAWDRLVIADVDPAREPITLPSVPAGTWIGGYSWQPIPP